MADFVEFSADLARLDALYVSASSDEFDEKATELCEKYSLDEETLYDTIEDRNSIAARLWRERHVSDTMLEEVHADELDEIPWFDHPIDNETDEHARIWDDFRE